MNTNSQPLIKVNIIIPTILLLMIFSLMIDNSFKIISPDLVKYFQVDASTVSWQITLSGLVVGIGAIVYATLSDSISIRNLFLVGITLICGGSIFGYLVHDNYWLVVIARIIQSAGLGATETLYLITVAKYLSAQEQKKFMGFSTSSFQIATVVGTLTGGFIATYLQWQDLFLVPLLTVLFIPFIYKYLPRETGSKSHVDIFGMIFIGSLAASILVCISSFSWLTFALFIIATIIFFTYISKASKAFITIDFFKNKIYVLVLIMVLIIYTTQAAYAFNTFPFMLTSVYGVQLDKVSLMFIPASLMAALTGALTGRISKYLSSKACVYLAHAIIIASVFLSIFFLQLPMILFTITLIIFSCAYALMYAPLIDTALCKVSVEHAGTALGFYNLCINIAMSIGFTYSSFLIDRHNLLLNIYQNTASNHYAGILLAIGMITTISLLIFRFLVIPKMPQQLSK